MYLAGWHSLCRAIRIDSLGYRLVALGGIAIILISTIYLQRIEETSKRSV